MLTVPFCEILADHSATQRSLAMTKIILALVFILAACSGPPTVITPLAPTPHLPQPRFDVGAATLEWTPPTTNTDGSTLTDLAGYRVDYGKSSTALDTSIDVPNPGITAFVVEPLTPGTWYFGMRAYNAQGANSVESAIVSKTIL